jgi:hypothetical protein
MRILSLSLLLLVGCCVGKTSEKSSGSHGIPSAAVRAEPTSTASPAFPPPPDASAPSPVRADAYQNACRAECSDELAEVTTYRKDNGDVGVITVQGTPAACSHAPLRFFGPDGAERATIPFVAVAPGASSARRFDEIRTRELNGLHRAESRRCRDIVSR